MDIREIAGRTNKTETEVATIVEFARRSLVPKSASFAVTEFGRQHKLTITREGVGPLKTPFGRFHHFSFTIDDKWHKYSVLSKSSLSDNFIPVFQNNNELTLRIDSGCETGQLFGDKTCECSDQLQKEMENIERRGEGMIISIPRQDGRGLGLPFKLATLRLQDELDVDTIDASTLLDPAGLRDTRTYAGVVGLLLFLEIPTSTQLYVASNNPKKNEVFAENGYKFTKLKPLLIPPTALTERHLKAKQEKLGHIGLVQNPEDKES